MLRVRYLHQVSRQSKPKNGFSPKFSRLSSGNSKIGKSKEIASLSERSNLRFNQRTKEAWLNEELQTFQYVSVQLWTGVVLWSLFWWWIWSSLVLFISLIFVTRQKESSKIPMPHNLSETEKKTAAEILEMVVKSKLFLEERCYQQIMTSRQYLNEVRDKFFAFGFLTMLSCWCYYYHVGKTVGLSPGQNAVLSFKRLLRRRGFLWHACAFGYVYLAHATINAYYDTYIMTPQFRGLSTFDESKRELVSAYGGKGFALARIMNRVASNEKFKLDYLSESVAFHRSVPDITHSIKLVQSDLFVQNWGLKFRSDKLHDGIPPRCWFRSSEHALEFVTMIDKLKAKKKKRLERQIVKAKIWPQKTFKPQSREIKGGPVSNEATTGSSGNDKQASEQAPEKPQKFQVGKCFGSLEKDDRFIKASQLEINKAMMIRLKTVDLLISVDKISKEFLAAESLLSKTWIMLSYFSCIAKFLDHKSHFLKFERDCKFNHEEHCICNYYPYYGGYFV